MRQNAQSTTRIDGTNVVCSSELTLLRADGPSGLLPALHPFSSQFFVFDQPHAKTRFEGEGDTVLTS